MARPPRSRRLVACWLLVVLAAPSAAWPASAPATDAGPRVDVEGTAFTVTLTGGRVLRSPELAGLVLALRSGLRVRIEAVEEERDVRGGSLWLHTLAAQQADGTWRNLCRVGPDGRRAAFPVPGRARGDGTIAEGGPGDFEITCTAGAQAKCVRLGYRQWAKGPDGGSLRDLYNACIRMVRADYGGDGQGTTRDGMPIDVYDVSGIQTPDMVAGQDFEAAWDADGAVCVRHVRVKDNATLEALEGRYPRLRGRTGAACTEDLARRHGARLFNRSAP